MSLQPLDSPFRGFVSGAGMPVHYPRLGLSSVPGYEPRN